MRCFQRLNRLVLISLWLKLGMVLLLDVICRVLRRVEGKRLFESRFVELQLQAEFFFFLR
ncbi:RxLR-like protein [Plasmopara halstedii]|uniref:RxLR-like protein n=1 Tax=Plasmopara halstedii TaxID=4781 RepID=A0A0P1AIJ7_PLAHL|nr:RxLR-like protein [Plasmopara halstedii]CEG40602.1 RxLR-like protein [Plasmopara halstedii]|eukprot:XP_024576971.1 RxLR-like protein [Plasmopara halstedii]